MSNNIFLPYSHCACDIKRKPYLFSHTCIFLGDFAFDTSLPGSVVSIPFSEFKQSFASELFVAIWDYTLLVATLALVLMDDYAFFYQLAPRSPNSLCDVQCLGHLMNFDTIKDSHQWAFRLVPKPFWHFGAKTNLSFGLRAIHWNAFSRTACLGGFPVFRT